MSECACDAHERARGHRCDCPSYDRPRYIHLPPAAGDGRELERRIDALLSGEPLDGQP